MPQTIKKKPKEPDLLVLAMRKAHAQIHGKPTGEPVQKRPRKTAKAQEPKVAESDGASRP